MNIAVGQQFPNFSGRTFDGQYFDLRALAGKNVVVYFYPKDDTSGCACEAQEFSHLLHQFHRANTEVLGVSVDSLESHERFAGKYNLKVPLISDSQKTFVQKLGIERTAGTAARTTFVLDGEGTVRKIFETVNPNGHADIVLTYIKEAMSAKASPKKERGRAHMAKQKIIVKK